MTRTDDHFSFSPELRDLLDSVPATADPVDTAPVLFTAGGTDFEGFVARPGDSAEPRPGVLVLHDWFGMADHVRVRAEMLARLGYIAFAADLYGAGVRPSSNDEASELVGSYYGDVEHFRAHVLANLEALRSQPGVDLSRIAVMGYCFGGAGALELARAGADVQGIVAFHGALGTKAPATPGSIKAPVLVLTGAEDPMVPPSVIEEFKDELRVAGADDWQIISYSGALHAFAVPGTNAPEFGVAYQETANRRSWVAMKDFFAEVLA